MLNYNKEVEKIKKPRVIRGGSGPRDLQRKQREAQSVKKFNRQVELLDGKLEPEKEQGSTSDKKYSEEELAVIVNESVRSVVLPIEDAAAKDIADASIEIEHLRTKLNSVKGTLINTSEELNIAKIELAVVKSKLESKDELLKVKDDTINTLKDRPVNVNVSGAVIADSPEIEENRPKMEHTFIDPTEKKELAPHLKFKDVVVEEKEAMSNKVDKLKNLLGGLPKR